MLYFTSDLHLGHDRALEFSGRHFDTIDQMNATLIHNLNACVDKNDELWILGDFAYKVDRQQVRIFRDQIECRKVHLVMGNHDLDYAQDHIFQSVQSYKELKTPYGKVVLFHYPILEWSAAHYGSIHLHGHIHSTGKYNEENLQKFQKDRFPEGHGAKHPEQHLRIYDVGVDANEYRPIGLDDIAEKMNIKPDSSGNNIRCSKR